MLGRFRKRELGIINAVIKMATVKRRDELSDEELECIKDLLPSNKLKNQGRPPKLNRDMLNAILWKARSCTVGRKTGTDCSEMNPAGRSA